MCERCVKVAEKEGISADIIDLRTLSPWDKEAVFESVKKTNRCLIVHEDTQTAGFGAEISSQITEHLFKHLDAPVWRHTMPDIPMPYNVGLMNAVLPGIDSISELMNDLISF